MGRNPLDKDEKPFTEVTVRNEHGEYGIKMEKTELTIHEFVQEFIKPLLLTMGYHHKLVDEYIEDC